MESTISFNFAGPAIQSVDLGLPKTASVADEPMLSVRSLSYAYPPSTYKQIVQKRAKLNELAARVAAHSPDDECISRYILLTAEYGLRVPTDSRVVQTATPKRSILQRAESGELFPVKAPVLKPTPVATLKLETDSETKWPCECGRNYSTRDARKKHQVAPGRCAARHGDYATLLPLHVTADAIVAVDAASTPSPLALFRLPCECGRKYSTRDARKKHQLAPGRCTARYGDAATIPNMGPTNLEPLAGSTTSEILTEELANRVGCECGKFYSTRDARKKHQLAPGRCTARYGDAAKIPNMGPTNLEPPAAPIVLEVLAEELPNRVGCECGKFYSTRDARKKHQLAPGRCTARHGALATIAPGVVTVEEKRDEDKPMPLLPKHEVLAIEPESNKVYCECGRGFSSKDTRRKHQAAPGRCPVRTEGKLEKPSTEVLAPKPELMVNPELAPKPSINLFAKPEVKAESKEEKKEKMDISSLMNNESPPKPFTEIPNAPGDDDRAPCECGKTFSTKSARRKHQKAEGRCEARYGPTATIKPHIFTATRRTKAIDETDEGTPGGSVEPEKLKENTA
ncbi:hypothetical protein BABINDRAFT_160817 [Babjeviella inositovora NRRL Y-12698]|uniref:C2H2-type domain-containing protein n=1 Tax=Babjeviella inositovora NRRL Y-12698 TaxID=984486 RepID=A0A1E3QSA8_9ASCO|nr:uncharacterized protein BABINDRAFT_160817 [Babjeviella inositovora NRRL Y-12698]ODQ80550.1 hypothetical protein BABINDRAFT_160817 [Babjeviella inositovora NRRL Y-12698]